MPKVPARVELGRVVFLATCCLLTLPLSLLPDKNVHFLKLQVGLFTLLSGFLQWFLSKIKSKFSLKDKGLCVQSYLSYY